VRADLFGFGSEVDTMSAGLEPDTNRCGLSLLRWRNGDFVALAQQSWRFFE
jgi:hypothetical protein